MDLRNFIAETITSVMGGVEDAQKALGDDPNKTAEINPDVRQHGDKATSRLISTHTHREVYRLEFDIAVTVEDGAKAGGGIKVVGVHIGSEIAGKTTAISRITFSIPITYPPARRRGDQA